MTHICVGKLTIIGSDNGLSPGRRQAIIWTNARKVLIRPLGTNFSEISIGIETFSFKKMYLKMSSAKWRPFCLGLNVLIKQCMVFPKRWLYKYSYPCPEEKWDQLITYDHVYCIHDHSENRLPLTWLRHKRDKIYLKGIIRFPNLKLLLSARLQTVITMALLLRAIKSISSMVK